MSILGWRGMVFSETDVIGLEVRLNVTDPSLPPQMEVVASRWNGVHEVVPEIQIPWRPADPVYQTPVPESALTWPLAFALVASIFIRRVGLKP